MAVSCAVSAITMHLLIKFIPLFHYSILNVLQHPKIFIVTMSIEAHDCQFTYSLIRQKAVYIVLALISSWHDYVLLQD